MRADTLFVFCIILFFYNKCGDLKAIGTDVAGFALVVDHIPIVANFTAIGFVFAPYYGSGTQETNGIVGISAQNGASAAGNVNSLIVKSGTGSDVSDLFCFQNRERFKAEDTGNSVGDTDQMIL